jgi:transaldolase
MQNTGYFQRVTHTTPTRFWVNNPTYEQARLAIEAGAVGCTTNPSYVSKLLSSPADRAYVERTIKVLLPHIKDNTELASVVQRIMVARLSDIFMPMYEASEGSKGFVTIQGDPFEETKTEAIIADGIESRKIGDNITVKIPVTTPGIKAIATLVEQDVPTMATEVMGISQAISIAEAYKSASENSGHRPPFYLTHITGILDDHFKRVIKNEGIKISDEAVKWAGLSIAKKQYRLLKERAYPGTMIGGGARKLEDFTELVGGDLHITINWKGTADTLLDLDKDVTSRINVDPDQAVIDELMTKLPDYRRAYEEDGMSEDEYYDFGGVELFRSSFMKGWETLLDLIQEMRGGM